MASWDNLSNADLERIFYLKFITTADITAFLNGTFVAGGFSSVTPGTPDDKLDTST